MTARMTTRKFFMKSYCKGLVITREDIEHSYNLWSKALAGKKNHYRIIEEYGCVENLLEELYLEISTRTLNIRPLHYYFHREPTNGKLRRIGIQSVKQQILDYIAIYTLTSFLEARIGYYQVASIPGKGQLFAAKTIRKWSQQGGYWVHMDVHQCYPSIRPEKVKEILLKYIKSDDVHYIIDVLLGSYERGLMIGSYFSLKMAQLVLSFGYHYIEGAGKTRRGKHKSLVTHQLHYMDDILLMSQDKRDLSAAATMLEVYFREEFDIFMKPWKICKVGDDEPIDMAGFVVRPNRTTVRDSIFLRARHSLNSYNKNQCLSLAQRVCSYWGWIKNADTFAFQYNNHVLETVRLASQQISNSSRLLI